jgi:hypothetical protein
VPEVDFSDFSFFRLLPVDLYYVGGIGVMGWVREDRSAKASGRTADMHVLEKSGCAVVPVNLPNRAAIAAAEAGEGRAQMKENIGQPRMLPTQSGNRMSQRLDGVRKAAKERKQERFLSKLNALKVAFSVKWPGRNRRTSRTYL